MKWSDSIGSGCRWAEYAEPFYEGYDIIYDNSQNNYQGDFEMIGLRINHSDIRPKYIYLHYDYGSCSGCDAYENMTDLEVKKEMNDLLMEFEDDLEFNTWIEMLRTTNGNSRLITNMEEYFNADKKSSN